MTRPTATTYLMDARLVHDSMWQADHAQGIVTSFPNDREVSSRDFDTFVRIFTTYLCTNPALQCNQTPDVRVAVVSNGIPGQDVSDTSGVDVDIT
jgi:hypothetical protein